MNPTILTLLILAAYLTVATLAWRPLTRRIYEDERQESLRLSWKRDEWDPARVRRKSGLAAVFLVLIWPITALTFGLLLVVPPLYRRIMDKATFGIGDADRESDQDPARALDDLDPVDAVVMAWTMHEGSALRHEVNTREVADTMPALARALDRLTQERHADT